MGPLGSCAAELFRSGVHVDECLRGRRWLDEMLSHGVISGALFLIVGVVYDRMHTREIAFYGGLVNRMPWYAAVFMLFTMGNVGLPGTSGFIGEILTMTGTYGVSTWTAIVAATASAT